MLLATIDGRSRPAIPDTNSIFFIYYSAQEVQIFSSIEIMGLNFETWH